MNLPSAQFRSALCQCIIIILLLTNRAIAVKENLYLRHLDKPNISGPSWKPENTNIAILPPPSAFKFEIANTSEKYGWVPLVLDRKGRTLLDPNNKNGFRELNIIAVQPINNSLSEGDVKQTSNRFISKPTVPTYAYVIKNSADEIRPLPAKYNVQIITNERPSILRDESAQNTKEMIVDFKKTLTVQNSKNITSKSEHSKLTAIDLLIRTMTDIQYNLHKILEIASNRKENADNIPAHVIERNAREQEPTAAKRAISGVPQGSILAPPHRFIYVRPADLNSKREKQDGVSKHTMAPIESNAAAVNDTADNDIEASESLKTEHFSELIERVKKLSDGLDLVSPTNNYEKSRRSQIEKVSQSRSLNVADDHIPLGFPHSYNSLNHLPPDPLTALFLSHYGHYMPGLNGREAGFRNLYGYTASNSVHNNQPVGGYKVFEDQDKR